MKKAIVFLAVALAVLAGCASFNRLVATDSLVSQLAVEAAVARVVHEHPSWAPAAKSITGGALQAIDAKVTLDLASVEAYVKGYVKWEALLPEEQAVVSALISGVVANLEDSFRARGVVDPAAQLVEVRQVVQWVHDAASRAAK